MKYSLLTLLAAIALNILFAPTPSYAKAEDMKKLDLPMAYEIAQTYLAQDGNPHQFTIIEDKTKKYAFGYAFFYAPKKYLETNDQKYLVPGAGLVLVDKSDLKPHTVSSSVPPQTAIDIYEKEWLAKNTGR